METTVDKLMAMWQEITAALNKKDFVTAIVASKYYSGECFSFKRMVIDALKPYTDVTEVKVEFDRVVGLCEAELGMKLN